MTVTERLPLTRERVAAAALAIGDEHGLDGLTMRSVGAALGVEAMSLYNHVANKDDLLDAIGDRLYGDMLEIYVPDPARAWRDDAWELVAAFYTVATQHPNIVSILLDRPIPSGTKVEFLHQCYRVFVKAGYPIREAALAFNTVSSWLLGAVRSELGLMRTLDEQGVRVTKDDVPEEFHDTVDFMQSCLSWTPQERLESGFRTVIAGVEQELDNPTW